jgi:hypothetical protein
MRERSRPYTAVALVATVLLVSLLVACGGDWSSTSSSPTGPTVIRVGGTALCGGVGAPVSGTWRTAGLDSFKNGVMVLKCSENSQTISLDLGQMAVFDCRTDCNVAVGTNLASPGANDEICLYSESRSGTEVPVKLWVNRKSCP